MFVESWIRAFGHRQTRPLIAIPFVTQHSIYLQNVQVDHTTHYSMTMGVNQTVTRLICTFIQILSMTFRLVGNGNYVMKYFTKTMKG